MFPSLPNALRGDLFQGNLSSCECYRFTSREIEF